MKQSITKYNSIKPTWDISDGQFIFYLQQSASDTAVIAQVSEIKVALVIYNLVACKVHALVL